MQVFIISWAGQHENASRIAEQVSKTTSRVAIVYSDPDQNFKFGVSCNLIKRSNELFWEDKFKSCLDAAGDEGFLVIHADCSCDDWALLVKRCSDITLDISDIGVWAPQIHGTYWNLSVSRMLSIRNTDLVLSAMTDGIVFYLAPQVIKRMRLVTWGKNKFGWGIASLFCATSHVDNKLVVIDTAVKVTHPQAQRGYDGFAAKSGNDEFLNQFSLRERIEYMLLLTYVHHNHVRLSTEAKGLYKGGEIAPC